MPVVPYWLPGLYHTIPILINPTDFVFGTIKRFGWERPFQLKAGPTNFTLTANPFHIQEIFKSRFLSAKSITRISAKNLLDIPSKILAFYDADDSGMAAEPRKGSKTAQEDRILYHQTHSAQKFLAAPYLGSLAERYLKFFNEHVDRLAIGETWVEYPDLYKFLQMTVSRANIEAMMGSKIFEVNPGLIEHFWLAKRNAHLYFRGWPRWLIPTAFRERDRVVDEIEKWHTYAFKNGNVTESSPRDPDWEPIFGSRYAKARLQYMLKMKSLTARVRACEDWGLIANGNTAPSAFWYIFEALRDPSLSDRLSAEADTCISANGKINIDKLGTRPLLQSTYAEVLRLRVSILVSRMVEFGDVTFSGYTIRRNEFVLMPTDGVHFSEEAWARAGRPSKKPLLEFDAERFLVESDMGPEFSTEGLAGLWIPFGGGERMCPGRHLAKLEMILTYAYLFSKYDIELGSVGAKDVQCDMKFAPFGALPPNRKVPFRIRRKTQA
ncbi:cytochrome P450 [Truncatella angustata]|uniref:Cytochrome P450 n=1 Tax=Truncatella angustata TaxID=152316 RepID=A0A9P8UJI0_9PEZI|nr:cytochrome P450 [Truncatella angustata]KAH6653321.1 cytochrome P450 [Truncatella angustata]